MSAYAEEFKSTRPLLLIRNQALLDRVIETEIEEFPVGSDRRVKYKLPPQGFSGVITEVGDIESACSNGSEIVQFVSLEGAKDLNSLLDIADEFWNSGGIGEGGIARDKGFEALIDLSSLNSKEEGFQLFLDRRGWWFGIGISGKKLGDEGCDLGKIGRSSFVCRCRPSGQARQKNE